LVVDTSIFVSMLLSKRAEAWKIFELKHEYHTLDLTFIEIKRHFLMIWMRSRLTRQEFAETLLTIPTMVKIFPLNEIPSATLREAHDIIGLRDPGDTPFVALMLHINSFNDLLIFIAVEIHESWYKPYQACNNKSGI